MQEALAAKAERALDSARMLVQEDPDAAVNRAYYACLHIARAALVKVGEQPKTHSGTHNRFALHFVASGRISQDIARTLPFAAEVRERADYNTFAITDTNAAADLVADAERFVRAVRVLL